MGEILMESEEISTPRSPQQSDSEASTSSLEIGSRVGSIVLSTPPTVQEPVKCRWQYCGLWFTHLDQLAGHVTMVHASAGEGGLFYCGWEGCARGHRGFNARYKMLVHVRTHTNEKPHRCNKCDKSFSRAENLKIHARSHTGERPYACPVPGCTKAYSNSSDRFKHTRTHAVDKPYVCKVEGCPKRYTDPSSLRKHVKTYRHFPGSYSAQSQSPRNSLGGSDEEESRSAFRPVASFSFSPASVERAPLPGEYRGIPIKKSISARVRQTELDSSSVSDYEHTTDGSLSPPTHNQRTWTGGRVWLTNQDQFRVRTSPETSPSCSPMPSPSLPITDWHLYSTPLSRPESIPLPIAPSHLETCRSWPWSVSLWNYPPLPLAASCATAAREHRLLEDQEQVVPLDLTVARH